MGKFNVGDIVVGNEFANKYSLTYSGVKCVVIDIFKSKIQVRHLNPTPIGIEFGNLFLVDPEDFDLDIRADTCTVSVPINAFDPNYILSELQDIKAALETLTFGVSKLLLKSDKPTRKAPAKKKARKR